MNLLKRTLLPGLALCSLLTVFTSCEEKDYTSRLPSFAGFQMNMDAPSRGDSITITARQAAKGYLLNGTVYQWTITDSRDSTVYSEKQDVIYDHNSSDPKIGFRIPADARTGRYTVTFYAEYKYSGQDLKQPAPSGNLGDPSITGTIKPVSPASSQIFRGACKGDVSFYVVE